MALAVGVTAKRSLSDAIWSSAAAQVWLMLLILETMPLACALQRSKVTDYFSSQKGDEPERGTLCKSGCLACPAALQLVTVGFDICLCK